jgi:serine-type D-Ala-D-Ala carboxypeptidase (penicillin-binding protein 5/6)
LGIRAVRALHSLLLTLVLALVPSVALAQEFDTKAKFAVLMDYESGSLLFHKNADEPMEPASMAKLMTIAVVFNEIKKGKLGWTDEFFISENAWRTGGAASGGSTMFAELNSKVSVENLVRSVIIQSGNDAAIALAEGIAGSELTFARLENQLAKEIGLTGSNFVNSTGLPDPLQFVTARDLAVLARYIIMTYPEYYPIFSEPDFEWNNIKQANRNSLVEMGIGVDGLKTGHTEASGYGTVVSSNAGERRIIAVLHGLGSMNERAEEARKLITYGLRSFEVITAYAEGQTVGYADVYGGAIPAVPLIGKGSIGIFIPRGAEDCPQASIVYKGPLMPPVQEGEKVADLEVMCDGTVVQVTPLYAAETVEEGDIFRKSMDALKHLAIGWIP